MIPIYKTCEYLYKFRHVNTDLLFAFLLHLIKSARPIVFNCQKKIHEPEPKSIGNIVYK